MSDSNAFQTWWSRCGVNFRMFAIAAASATTILVFWGQIEPYRFWATASEVQLLAERLYPPTIADQRRVITSIERDLDIAQSIRPTARSEKQHQKIQDLKIDLQRAQDELSNMINERARFRAYRK